MESIYWVLSWACHRRCRHCYDDRFRPYVRDGLRREIDARRASLETIIRHLPDDFSFRGKSGDCERGRLILAGGELLLDGVRDEIFYPALTMVRARYGAAAPRLSMQTTGDVLTPRRIEEMLALGVSTIAIASIDDFHAGLAGAKKFALMDKIRAMMAPFGVAETSLPSSGDARLKTPDQAPRGDAPTFLFFGAQPDLWIGELWPRGRAWANGLSNADYETNFCARWSGAKNFLNMGEAGSEVAIEPDGSVFPCCLKTRAPLGSLAEEPLADILNDLRKEPALLALNAGDPEAMGVHDGWSRATFRANAKTRDPTGRAFANPCIGCDAYFEERLGAVLAERRGKRLAARQVVV